MPCAFKGRSASANFAVVVSHRWVGKESVNFLFVHFFSPTSFLFTSLNLEAVQHGSRLYVELGLALLRNTSPVGNWGFASVICFNIVLVKGLEGNSLWGST